MHSNLLCCFAGKNPLSGPLASWHIFTLNILNNRQFFFFFVILGPQPQHMEVPRLGVKSELLLPAYTTATAMPGPSRFCNLHHSSQQCQILNPLSEARNRTCILMDAGQICFHEPWWDLPAIVNIKTLLWIKYKIFLKFMTLIFPDNKSQGNCTNIWTNNFK